MKKLITFISLTAILLAGCNHSTYWYQPDTSVQQAKADWTECYQYVYGYSDAYRQFEYGEYYEEQLGHCMVNKNYTRIAVERVPDELQTETGILKNLEYRVAGDN